MPARPLRVLVVDDDRDGADTLGLIIEELGNQVHVTYGGEQALGVATAFRPDVMFIDMAMPHMDGCDLVARFRQNSLFQQTPIIAITGHSDDAHQVIALKAGFDSILFKPIPIATISVALDGVQVAVPTSVPRRPTQVPPESSPRLQIRAARRIRNERDSKSLTRPESEAAICEGVVSFQQDFLGWRSDQIQVHFINDLVLVRIRGALTPAERQLSRSLKPENGRDLIKQVRKQLLELARPMLESLIHEVIGVKATSMHHDISTVTGEEIVMFSLGRAPRFI